MTSGYKYDRNKYHIVEMQDKVFAIVRISDGFAVEHINASQRETVKTIEASVLR